MEAERAFVNDLEGLINRHCRENPSNTPDWILAQHLMACLQAFDTATQQRETWYGRDARPGSPSFCVVEGGGVSEIQDRRDYERRTGEVPK